jgi:hypothetical protein
VYRGRGGQKEYIEFYIDIMMSTSIFQVMVSLMSISGQCWSLVQRNPGNGKL